MRAARVAARERRGGDDAAHRREALEVQPVVPGEVEAAVRIAERAGTQLGFNGVQIIQCRFESGSVAHDADLLPHDVVELLAQRLEIAPRAGFERPLALRDRAIDRGTVRFPHRLVPYPRGHAVARHGAEYGRVGDTVAAE